MADGHPAWDLVARDPRPDLRGALRSLVDYRERTAGGMTRRELPSDAVAVIVSLDGPVLLHDADRPQERPRTSHAFLAAMHERHAIVTTPYGWSGVQVDLSPLAARAIVGGRMRDATGRVVDLEDLVGARAVRLLCDALHSAAGPRERLDVTEAFAARAVDAVAPPPPDVTRAWQRLRASGGRMPVGALAAELGCSRRHLAARFAEHVGLAPKRAARVLRFQAAVRELGARPPRSLADIAAGCGYADQAHMTREITALAGRSPSALRAGFVAEGGGIAA